MCISPYYIWLGRSRSADVTRFLHAFEIESGNTIGNMTPKSLRAVKASDDSTVVPELEIGEPALRLESRQEWQGQDVVIDVSPPLSSFHYQVKNVSNFSPIGRKQMLIVVSYSLGGCLIMSKQSIKSSAPLSMLSHG